MPKILGLDLSSSTGYAIVTDKGLGAYGNISSSPKNPNHSDDLSYFYRSMEIGKAVARVILKESPDEIFIEQINLGRNRMSQKFLDFVHFAVLLQMPSDYHNKVRYVDTSMWRTDLEVKLTKEQRLHNTEVAKKRRSAKGKGQRFSPGKGNGKIGWKHLSTDWANKKYSLELKVSAENDIADAIAVATFGLKKHGQNVDFVKEAVKKVKKMMSGR